jgi:hypothetical protein
LLLSSLPVAPTNVLPSESAALQPNKCPDAPSLASNFCCLKGLAVGQALQKTYILNSALLIAPSPRTKLVELLKSMGETGAISIPDSIGYLL